MTVHTWHIHIDKNETKAKDVFKITYKEKVIKSSSQYNRDIKNWEQKKMAEVLQIHQEKMIPTLNPTTHEMGE